jgi:hypothetical protein
MYYGGVIAFERVLLAILLGLTTSLLVPGLIGVSIATLITGGAAGILVGIMVYCLPSWN